MIKGAVSFSLDHVPEAGERMAQAIEEDQAERGHDYVEHEVQEGRVAQRQDLVVAEMHQYDLHPGLEVAEGPGHGRKGGAGGPGR